MATGHFRSPTNLEDENGEDIAPFLAAETHAAKIKFACTHYPLKAPPGSHWVYHTSDTYLLGTALAAWYRARQGADSDLYLDVLVRPLWSPLKLSPTLAVSRRTYDAERQPFVGFGLVLQRDDFAKLANFLNRDRGAIAGKQMLDREMLNEALQANDVHAGHPAPTEEFLYKSGFWAWNAQKELGCAKPLWIPQMLGYGGVVVALFPNDISYYYVSDGGTFRLARAARAADRIKSMCER
jgi:hypothetical protein